MTIDNNRLERDKDQILVNQFIEALNNVTNEMKPLDENDNIGYVLITKLKRVYEKYKDTVLSNNNFDYLIDYYYHLQTEKEENQVVENPISLITQLSKHKKRVEKVEVKSDKKEDNEVQLVNQFISDLNQVVDEMETVEKNDYYEVVLEAKLLKLMKSYGESLCLGTTMNVYSHYKKQREKKAEEKKEDISPLTMQFLSNGKVITVPCHIKDDGSILCDPFPQSATIVGSSLLVDNNKNIDTGIYFEYKGFSTKVGQLNCSNGGHYYCSDGRLMDSTIPRLYEKFKNNIDK